MSKTFDQADYEKWFKEQKLGMQHNPHQVGTAMYRRHEMRVAALHYVYYTRHNMPDSANQCLCMAILWREFALGKLTLEQLRDKLCHSPTSLLQ